MGSNMSPTIADIFMQHFEGVIMEPTHDVISYNRFADDFLIISKKGTFDSIVGMFNNIDPFMTFTTESSLNNIITFWI